MTRRKYADLNGEGARLFGGRYNPPGVPAVYASERLSCALEVRCGFSKPRSSGRGFST
ncbi:MAG: RES domain-containing protein [Bryobacteraceae bacterium]